MLSRIQNYITKRDVECQMNCNACVFEEYKSSVHRQCNFCSGSSNPPNKIILTQSERGVYHPIASGFSEQEAENLIDSARKNGAKVEIVCWNESTAAFAQTAC